MKSHEKEQLLTTIIQIDSNKIFKCKNINVLRMDLYYQIQYQSLRDLMVK